MSRKTLADWIYERGYCVGAISKALSVPEKLVVDWCIGCRVPRTADMIKLASILNCDLADLYLALLRTVFMG